MPTRDQRIKQGKCACGNTANHFSSSGWVCDRCAAIEHRMAAEWNKEPSKQGHQFRAKK